MIQSTSWSRGNNCLHYFYYLPYNSQLLDESFGITKEALFLISRPVIKGIRRPFFFRWKKYEEWCETKEGKKQLTTTRAGVQFRTNAPAPPDAAVVSGGEKDYAEEPLKTASFHGNHFLN